MGARLIFAWGISAGALVAASAHAQEQPHPTDTVSAEAAATAEAQAQGADIIVTATRRNERIQDVPGQVSALTGDTLDQIRAKTLVDFAAYTPGVSFEATSPNTNRVVIRGITTGGTQLNSAIGLYLDDVPLGSSTPFGAGVQAINIGLFDLQRIEVLNGPQGTLFGANALGGTLRYLTQAPVPGETSGRVEGEIGHSQHGDVNYAGRGVLNMPISDTVALRIDAIGDKSAGFINDPDHNRSNVGDARLLTGRAALLFQATPDLSIRLSGFAQSSKSNGNATAFRDPITHRPTEGLYDQSFASRQPGESKLYLASAGVDWDFGFGKLSSITAYQDNRAKVTRDFAVAYSAIASAAFGAAGIKPYVVNSDASTKRFTQELRLASASNHRFEWVVGGFYSHEKTFQAVHALNTADPQGRLLGFKVGEFALPSTVREFALFGNATLYLADTLDATVGVRQSWNKQVFTSSGAGLFVNPRAPATTISSTGSSDESVQTWLFNLRYRPTKATLFYGRVASGYRPGGPNLIFGGVGTGNDSFTSDKLWNYELGLKQSFTGGRGFFNLSGYRIDWSNIQQVKNVGGINQIINAGSARINGAEASLSYRVITGVNLVASGTYTDAKLNETVAALGINYAGARLPLTAKFSGAVAGSYDFKLSDAVSGSANLSFRHVGPRDAGYRNSMVAPRYRLAPYNIVDLTLSLRTGNGWEVGPYIKNIFDTRGEVSAVTITNQYVPTSPVPVTLSQPRTIGVVVGRSF